MGTAGTALGGGVAGSPQGGGEAAQQRATPEARPSAGADLRDTWGVESSGLAEQDPPPSSGNVPVDSFRPEQQTLVEDAERLSAPIGTRAKRNRALLTVLTGPQRGAVHKMPGDDGTLGRSEQADVSISDPGLSRIHARIYRSGETFYVEDAGSTNGTFVEEQRVDAPVRLEPGARIRLGLRTILTFSLHDALEEAATLSVHQAALHDRLTGVYNRGVFDDRLAAELAFARRHGTPLTLVLFDIDHFKQFNDRYGHLTGDAVLVAVGQKVQQTVRTEDILARYGGEEFAVIARSTTADRARTLGERIRKAVGTIRLAWGEDELSVKVSVGVATLGTPSQSDTATRLIEAADAALYEAKRTGRDRVVHADSLDR